MLNGIIELLFGKSKKKITKEHNKTVTFLMSHPLVKELLEWKTFRVRILDIDDVLKRKMAEYYLTVLFSKIYDVAIAGINEYEHFLTGNIDINSILIDALDQTRSEALNGGVPTIFLDQITTWLYEQVKILTITYHDLDYYSVYNSDIERGAFRLDLALLTIRWVTKSIEAVINNMNGELHTALQGSVFDNN